MAYEDGAYGVWGFCNKNGDVNYLLIFNILDYLTDVLSCKNKMYLILVVLQRNIFVS